MRTLGLLSWLLLLLIATQVAAQAPDPTQQVERLERTGLPNLHRLTSDLFCGGEPHGPEGFRSLADLGIKTVISVDGAAPDLTEAKRHGLRYVHLPIGYDDVPRSRLIELVVAREQLPGPIFIHCHHGLHRGPAAAVALWRAGVPELTDKAAEGLLKRLGTAGKYTGLYRAVQQVRAVSDQERAAHPVDKLPARAEVALLAEQMIEIDHRWAELRAALAETKAVSTEQAAAVVDLAERHREAGRLLQADDSDPRLRQALALTAIALEKLLDTKPAPADLSMAIQKQCTSCHERFRDHRAELASQHDWQLPVKAAAQRGLALVEHGAANYPKHRDCFSCHHQTLPLLAATSANRAGLSISPMILADQGRFTQKSLDAQRERMIAGQQIGGRAATAGYALWTYQLLGRPADAETDALCRYLLRIQQTDGSWKPPSNRPPLEVSVVSCTTLAMQGLTRFGADELSADVRTSMVRARNWLSQTELRSTEDLAFALAQEYWTPAWNAGRGTQAWQSLLERQRMDGGWAAEPELTSEAYSTGQVLTMLLDSGRPLPADSMNAGLEYLVHTQHPDGSWHVPSRSKPIQEWFDNGDPHGPDQFISLTGSAWAVTALVRSLPVEQRSR